MKRIGRREFINQAVKAGAGLALLPSLASCRGSKSTTSVKKMVVLGIDGMDHQFLLQFVKEGRMPNFARLINSGGFSVMRSSIPPQSPVAWSDLSVGASAGVHGIFDFIHRDPATMIPYLSTAKVSAPERNLAIGGWEIPLSGGSVINLREGKPFWEFLAEKGVPATVFRMPGEFPVKSKDVRCVSGMGTPDLVGSYGTFSLFTSDPAAKSEKEITGGNVFPVEFSDNKIVGHLPGPVNGLRIDKPTTKVPFTVWRDGVNDVVKVKLQDHELILRKGEWSGWLRVSFEMMPIAKSVTGICKILIKEVHPHFQMYVSPINVDPVDQSLPVASPADYGSELTRKIGLFGTKGLPADTKALTYGVLSEEEYIQSSGQILEESKKAFRYELERLRKESPGFLFFYFSNIDQDTHMYWRSIDPAHPMYRPELAKGFQNTIRDMYLEMDRVLGDVYKAFDLGDKNFRLVVMSDHGFGPFYRSVNLNSWLLENGYASVNDRSSMEKYSFFENVDWQKTKAYGLGINALYVNLDGRERYGTVRGMDYGKFIAKVKSELLALKDPASGVNAISNVWSGREIYGRSDDKTPDLVIGWNRGYRASWETVLGGFTKDVFTNNDDKWSGDHCIDPQWVPAVLLANRPITKKSPALVDVTATILAEFGIPIPAQMTGKPLYDV
jgi:predicted AlkP superfamily phosphohydrolase/phosphomutase